jgi:chaperonin GroES
MTMENTELGTVNGIMAKRDTRGVVQIDLEKALEKKLPQARTVLAHAREFVPLRDQVMVRRLAEDEMTDYDTIHIPEEAQEKPMVGIALKVGRGKMDSAGVFHLCEVEPGDIVMFGRYSGTEHKVNGQTVLIMNESQIVGILR